MQQAGESASSHHPLLNHQAGWIRTIRGFRFETMRDDQQSNGREVKTPTLQTKGPGTGSIRQQENLKGLATRPIYFVRSQWKGEERPLDKCDHQE
jgi:hypothetical protein